MPSPLSDLYEALLAAVDSAFAGDRSAAAPESSGRARRWPWLPQIPYLNPAPPPPPASRLPRSFEECLRLCREKPETAAAGGAAAAALLAAIAALPRGLRRYRDVGDMTNDVFRRKTKITGIVTSVGDGDNFRLYHRPWAHRVLRLSVPSEARALQNETIHIRLAGIDAPEVRSERSAGGTRAGPKVIFRLVLKPVHGDRRRILECPRSRFPQSPRTFSRA
ncbi:MAG: hypothetical protein BJ554DRAFT_2131 [Olpidium bornovanus]|uniref:Uncharacterized protein n=1 Tax=Olpidium bornovanus TaxID=278681 RepID=A0A8H8DGW6_9FUNG|nr:MAG: hypothetical protein BJ554DRAFT_2131 [Olpidium bornovanus]